MNLTKFTTTNFLSALKSLFQELQMPVNYLTDEPASAKTILKDTYKDNETFNLIDDLYFLGMVDDTAFSNNDSAFINNDDAARASTAQHKSMELAQIKSNIKSDYDGVLIFGITLKQRENSRLPTRSQLAQIARAFNREFFYTPVVAVFKYDRYLAFANTERLKYKQEWREGEKAGKVTLLRDIDLKNPHAGHLRILNDLKLPKTGKNKVDSFATIYSYWQDVFSANILNKKFYQELSNWYFWAIKEVTFPSEPTEADAHLKKIDLAALKQEHNAKNVIRLLTRFLFVWFIKEKKLIPEELFDMHYLTNDLLKNMNPVLDAGLFQEANKESIYYKAVLQNLFFASLNCPIEPDEKGDNRKRGFRLKDNFGQHRDANYLMRYQDHFKNPDKFLELMNSVVPFLNGGLFECLDNKTDKIYIDGFSDNLATPHQLVVPDYLFFGFDQEVDLTEIVGINNKAYKNAKVKGLISILESYKFTVAENTPIEEDVALDPELLGKVFENLLASYNPETKTTARKQTGSFYTPREIVNYMVDESLIAYLKTSVKDWGRIEEQELDKKLHELFSYNEINPFAQDEAVQKQIIHALDNCKILDPACGSGAFPMGTLQKMVHILQKVDPDNKHWQELQLNKAVKETEGAFALADKKEREQKLIEINEAFDEKINDPDYARKLFLVENCIYGVDIQPIATQISKLRFFISLVVDQKVDREKSNFGIRALPNLETKFVAANTLIGIDKPDKQMDIFNNPEINKLKMELKNVRHRLFSVKSPSTKRKWREKDKELREKIGDLLVNEHDWADEAAKQLAAWDPYNQNDFSPFFDPEWMFGIADGFDVVIGNPPYVSHDIIENKKYLKTHYYVYNSFSDILCYFFEAGFKFLNTMGSILFITSNSYLRSDYAKATRDFIMEKGRLQKIINMPESQVFQNAIVDIVITEISLSSNINCVQVVDKSLNSTNFNEFIKNNSYRIPYNNFFNRKIWSLLPPHISTVQKIMENHFSLEQLGAKIRLGIATGDNDAFIINSQQKQEFINRDPKNIEIIKPILRGKDIHRYSYTKPNLFILLTKNGVNVKQDYPDIYTYFSNFGNSFKTRGAKGNHWTNLRACAFFDDFKKEKIIWIELTNIGKFALCDNEVYLLNSAYFLIPPKGIRIKYLLSILNSKAIGFYIKTIAATSGMGTIRWINNYVKQFPIPQISEEDQNPLVVIVDIILYLKNINSSNKVCFWDSIIDSLVFELYFLDHMKDRKIDILQFVEKDIQDVMQDREFDQLTDDQKEKVINQLHAKWTDPESEIVKRMNSFAEKSPDILKPILESC